MCHVSKWNRIWGGAAEKQAVRGDQQGAERGNQGDPEMECGAETTRRGEAEKIKK